MSIFSPSNQDEKDKHDYLMSVLGGLGTGLLSANERGGGMAQGLLGAQQAAQEARAGILNRPYKEMEMALKQSELQKAQLAAQQAAAQQARYNQVLGSTNGANFAAGGFDPARATPQQLEQYALYMSGGDPAVYSSLMSQFRQINPSLEAAMAGARSDASNASDLRYKPAIESATVTARGTAERPFLDEKAARDVETAGRTVTAQETARLPFATLDQQREIEAELKKRGLTIGAGGAIVPLEGYAESAAVAPAARVTAEETAKADVERRQGRIDELGNVEQGLRALADAESAYKEFDSNIGLGSPVEPLIRAVGSTINAFVPGVDAFSTDDRKRLERQAFAVVEPIYKSKVFGTLSDGDRATIERALGISEMSKDAAIKTLQEVQDVLKRNRDRLEGQLGVPRTTNAPSSGGGSPTRIRIDGQGNVIR